MTYRVLTPLYIPDISDDGILPPAGFTKLYTHEGKIIVKFPDGTLKSLDSVGTMGTRNVTISHLSPDNAIGVDGDIWIKY